MEEGPASRGGLRCSSRPLSGQGACGASRRGGQWGRARKRRRVRTQPNHAAAAVWAPISWSSSMTSSASCRAARRCASSRGAGGWWSVTVCSGSQLRLSVEAGPLEGAGVSSPPASGGQSLSRTTLHMIITTCSILHERGWQAVIPPDAQLARGEPQRKEKTSCPRRSTTPLRR